MNTRTLPDSSATLPRQHTSFIGRETEMAEIKALLADPHCRLVTLVGPGGGGKTRLGIETASHMTDDFPNGVFSVPLQPLQSSGQVASAIINVLNFRPDDDAEPEQSLLDYLCDLNLLLLLDNFEHLMDAAALVASILNVAPNVKLLVTSREPLNLHEEWIREVHGLAYPSNGAVSKANGYSALRLFAERARQLRAEFSFEAEYAHIVRICQLVDGLPLALELAAGWLRTLSCAAIAAEIEDNVDILASTTRNLPERHRSMRAVFAHSWRLLTDEERAVLPRFSVFRGGCTREAAEQVAGATLPILASLVEKSLLRHDPDTNRYDMQELLRQYAQEQLEGSSEGDAIRDSHSHYYAALFDTRCRAALGPAKTGFLDMAHVELDNIRVSWGWALHRGHFEVIDQLIDTLWMYYTDHNRTFELGTLCQSAGTRLAACTGKQERAILGRVLARHGKWEASQLKWDTNLAHSRKAESLLRQSMAIAREQDNLEEYYYAARWLAWAILAKSRHEYAEARHILEDCVAHYREPDSGGLLAIALWNLAFVCGQMGQTARQRELLHESYRLYQQKNYWHGMAEVLTTLSSSAIYEGCWDEAQQSLTAFTEKIPVESSIFYQWTAVRAHNGLLDVAIMEGNVEKAEQLEKTVSNMHRSFNSVHFLDLETTLGLKLSRSLIDAIKGTLDEALRLADEVIANVGEQNSFPELAERGRVIRVWVLCDLIQFDAASRALVEVLSAQPQYFRLSVYLMLAIAAAARILAHRGQHVRAAELLGLVFTFPNSPRGYLQRHRQMTQLRADLEAQLGADVFAAAWERGAQLDVEQVARDLLREFTTTSDDLIAQANQALAAPLTPRELEVLLLMGEGLRNRQIAEKLFVTTGTIKRYTSNIYGKLAVGNRVQAVSYARKIGLI